MATHWGWYWKVKMKHKSKSLCSWLNFSDLDSFKLFNNSDFNLWLEESKDRIMFVMPHYKLTIRVQDDNSLSVQSNNGSYTIPVEKKSCNYGGFYYFFHCPKCSSRMRKLYFSKGKYLCRKCANLSYYSQQLRPSMRNWYAGNKIETLLKNKGGSLHLKPQRMTYRTFQRLRIKYVKYDEQSDNEECKELILWYGNKISEGIDWYSPPSDMLDAYIER